MVLYFEFWISGSHDTLLYYNTSYLRFIHPAHDAPFVVLGIPAKSENGKTGGGEAEIRTGEIEAKAFRQDLIFALLQRIDGIQPLQVDDVESAQHAAGGAQIDVACPGNKQARRALIRIKILEDERAVQHVGVEQRVFERIGVAKIRQHLFGCSLFGNEITGQGAIVQCRGKGINAAQKEKQNEGKQGFQIFELHVI